MGLASCTVTLRCGPIKAPRDLGVFICFEDDAGQGLNPAEGPHLSPAPRPAGSAGARRRRPGQVKRKLKKIKLVS